MCITWISATVGCKEVSAPVIVGGNVLKFGVSTTFTFIQPKYHDEPKAADALALQERGKV
jgi:hypothetical protein